MRNAAMLGTIAAVAMALAITAARAEAAPPQIEPLIGGPTAATGYALPFDAANVPLAAPLGPLMAFGPSSPDEGSLGLSSRTNDEEHD